MRPAAPLSFDVRPSTAPTEMDLKQYARVLLAHWALIVATVVVCTVAAAAIAWTREPVYRTHTQLFVATTGSASDMSPSETYQGGLFSQQRVTSYANIVSSPRVAEAIVAELDLSRSVQQVQAAIQASVPEGTVLIDVTVTDSSPELAQAIANAVGQKFPDFINTLESSQPERRSPVKVSVTRPAELPTSPISPRTSLYLTMGLVLGLFLGIGGAVLREILDRRIRDDNDAAAIAGAPILGRITHDPAADMWPLIVLNDPDSTSAEEYRRLRTNLNVLGIDRGLRSFVVSSAVPSEGKTVIVANLGIAFAQAGSTVVLVDADLRRSRLAHVLGLESSAGLSEVLTGDVPLEAAVRRHRTLPVEVLAGGAPTTNPSELLGSERGVALVDALTRRADVVIFDAPAVLPVSDAAVLAGLASAVILVARVPSTRADQFELAAQSLRSVGKPPLGVVLNGLSGRNRWPFDNRRRLSSDEPSLQPVSVWDG